MGKLGTGINSNLNNAAATNDTRIASANIGETDYFSFDVATLSTLFQGLDVTKDANSAAQINLTNINAGSNAKAQIFAISQGAADALFGAVFNGGNQVLFGLRASDSKFVFGKNNNLASGALMTIDQNGAAVFTDALNTFRNFTGINTQTGTTYTAAAATDVGITATVFSNASGCTVTINDSSFNVGDYAFYQRGAGAGLITFVAGAGVGGVGSITLNSSPASSLKIANPNTTGGALVFKAAAGVYYIRGDLTP